MVVGVCLLARLPAARVRARSQRRDAVGARVSRQAQSELSAHVVGHEPAGHEVVAAGEAAGAGLGRGERYQHVGPEPILAVAAAGLRVPA